MASVKALIRQAKYTQSQIQLHALLSQTKTITFVNHFISNHYHSNWHAKGWTKANSNHYLDLNEAKTIVITALRYLGKQS